MVCQTDKASRCYGTNYRSPFHQICFSIHFFLVCASGRCSPQSLLSRSHREPTRGAQLCSTAAVHQHPPPAGHRGPGACPGPTRSSAAAAPWPWERQHVSQTHQHHICLSKTSLSQISFKSQNFKFEKQINGARTFSAELQFDIQEGDHF